MKHICLVCGGNATLYAHLDINKTCNNSLPLLNSFVEYVQCTTCQFIYCPTMCNHWSEETFLNRIYNDDYIHVDPDYTMTRPVQLAQMFHSFNLGKQNEVLDYGAGNTEFGRKLISLGYNVTSWDPMWRVSGAPVPKPNKKFDLISCFEVMEHVPKPITTILEIRSLLNYGGKLVFSTLHNDIIRPNEKDSYWYLSPRNGHICMHSLKSIGIMLNAVDMHITKSFNSVHIAECR